jgi:hypothetical protein
MVVELPVPFSLAPYLQITVSAEPLRHACG